MYSYASISRYRSSVRPFWGVISGVVLIFVIAAFAAIELRRLKDEHASLFAELVRLEQSLHASIYLGVSSNGAPSGPPLASSKILLAVTADMQALAQQDGLTVLDVNYTPVNNIIASNASRIDISTRFRGTYVSLRKLIAAMLSTYDCLALESVIVRRDRPTDLMLDIELHWTLFYRKQL